MEKPGFSTFIPWLRSHKLICGFVRNVKRKRKRNFVTLFELKERERDTGKKFFFFFFYI